MNENKQMVTPNIEAKITWINPDPTSSKKANESVKIGGAFVIYGISIVQGEKGLFLGMPTRFTKKNGEKSYSDIAHPITKEARDAMYKAVLGAYSQTQKRQWCNAPTEVPDENFDLRPVPSVPGVTEGITQEQIDELPFPYADPAAPEPDPESGQGEGEDEDSVPILGLAM